MKWKVVTICDYGPPFLVGNDFFVPGCELENGLCRFEYLWENEKETTEL